MATLEYRRIEGFLKQAASQTRPSGAARQERIGPVAAESVAMVASDLVMIFLAFSVALVLRVTVAQRLEVLVGFHSYLSRPSVMVSLGCFGVAYVLVAWGLGLYSYPPAESCFHDIRLVVQGCLNAGLLLFGALYLFRGEEVSRILVMLLVATASVTLCARRWLWRRGKFRHLEQGIDRRNVVILGTNQLSHAIGQHIERHQRLGYRFVGFITEPGAQMCGEIAPGKVLGGIERVRALMRQHFVDELVITEFYPTGDMIALVQNVRDLDIDVRAVAGYYGDLTTNAPVEYLGIFPVAALHRSAPKVVGKICKRVLDIVLSLAALVVTLPVLTAIVLAVKLDSPGPALYVSERIGKRGRVFPCFKFRTMVRDAEGMKQALAAMNERDGILFKCSNDPRVTRLGRFLRKYSLDELPQFLNVLRGEMSLVGPRPPITSEVEKYELEHFRRLEVLPGLTGLWQVEARHDPSFAKYIELDTAYMENWSFWLDLKILVRTATVVLQGTGM